MEKTEKMKRFERETGLKAIWRGKITNAYKKWEAGEKIYARNKERISLYVTKEMKNEWKEFIKNNDDIPGFSELIRMGITEYISLRKSINKTAFFKNINLVLLLFFL